MSVTLNPVVIELMVGDNVALAILQAPTGTFKGEAKRAPGDPRNPGIGRDLAVGRCLKAYGDSLESSALRLSDALTTSG